MLKYYARSPELRPTRALDGSGFANKNEVHDVTRLLRQSPRVETHHQLLSGDGFHTLLREGDVVIRTSAYDPF